MHEVFIEEQVKKICGRYKIDASEVEELIEKELSENPDLETLLSSENTLKQVYKTRIYKDFIKKIKKGVYYSLRTYQKDSSNLVKSHVSSAEREPYIESFFDQIAEYLKVSESIIDLGGGMFPAMFPFEKYPNIKKFIWLDKDEISYNKLLEFEGPDSLELLLENIGERTWPEIVGSQYIDFTFMLKLVPVVARQQNDLLEYLAKIPAKNILVTGSKEAMVKKENIQFREEKVIKDFISKTGKSIIKKVDIENEFGYVIS